MSATERRRYRKARGRRLEISLLPEVDDALRLAVAASGKDLTDFVQDAIVVKLRNWTPPGAFIAATRKATRPQAPVFDRAVVDRFGFPLQPLYPTDPVMELVQAWAKGPAGVKQCMRSWWKMNELDPDGYTDAMLAETLRQLELTTEGV